MKTFRQLVEEFARKGRPKTEPPMPMREVAQKLGVTRVHLYSLMNDYVMPRDHTVAKIAKGLGVSEKVVERALLAR